MITYLLSNECGVCLTSKSGGVAIFNISPFFCLKVIREKENFPISYIWKTSGDFSFYNAKDKIIITSRVV